MSKKLINVLLIEDTTEYADLIQDWLCGEGSDGSFVLNWTHSLEAGLERLATVPVDIILLDLSLPDSTGTNTFAKINEEAEDVPVIVLSAGKSESLALAMMGEGAADYLVKSTCTADALIRAIRYAIIRGNPQGERTSVREHRQNRLIAVLGAKGGVGTTTIAWNLAINLARQTSEKVLVCDLDHDAGLIAYLAGVQQPDHTLPDAVDNISRLDEEFFSKLVTHGPHGVDIVASPMYHGLRRMETEGVSRVISRVRGYYKWTVMDLGRPNVDSLQLASVAEEILLVTSTNLTSLYATQRFVSSLDEMERKRQRLVVNELNDTQRLSKDELGDTFGVGVAAVFPYESRLQKVSGDQRVLGDSGAFQKQMIRLARTLAGLREAKPKRTMGSFFFRQREENGGINGVSKT